MNRYRITVRGMGVELRGRMDELTDEDAPTLAQFAEAMKPFGLVIASPAEDDFDPFAISEPEFPPTPQDSADIIQAMWDARESTGAFLAQVSYMHYMQAVVIRGERGQRERAEALVDRITKEMVARVDEAEGEADQLREELNARELHHFETEQIIERALAAANDRESRSSVALAVVREILSGNDKIEGTFGRES